MSTATERAPVTGEFVWLDDEQYYRITDIQLMSDFFMSLVGASDHWMFISSNGALTAGRHNSDLTLFPYASDDKISSARADSGSTTLIRIKTIDCLRTGETWEPFAPHSRGTAACRRNLYKTPLGNKLILEEINETLKLAFRYRWTFSERFGFIRTCRLKNIGQESCALELLDGLKNVQPHGVTCEFATRFSNLVNAYKKSELVADSDVGLFYLSSIPTDRAEPSEGLRATTIWQTGLTPDATLLSADQLQSFCNGGVLQTETDVRGKPGAFLLHQSLELAAGETIEWHIVAELAQDHCDIVGLGDWLQRTSDAVEEITHDIEAGQRDLLWIVSSSDGIQCGSNDRRSNRHLSNTVFNVMRGGVPLENYLVHADNFGQYVASFNQHAFERHQTFLAGRPDVQGIAELQCKVAELNDSDLTRLSLEYLPLAFSRRHGDPTRPWNHFSINLRSDNGRTNLNYQGNWRDIFQNWEALGVSFPEFYTSMICRFVNATTADGYNPYRLTNEGFEWEEPNPDDPWANIGYWGDHQIIYLLKLMEWSQRFHPRRLNGLLNTRVFVHANVPYRIRDYEQIRKDDRATIDFDSHSSALIAQRVANIGADGKLLCNQQDEIHYVTLVEKLLTLSLAKLSNFTPDGGIWLNTQRPEWNDANNALVGSGLSVVTTCYLHRWFTFLQDLIADGCDETFHISHEVAIFLKQVDGILRQHANSLAGVAEPDRRLRMVKALSKAGEAYRNGIYANSFDGRTTELSRQECMEFFELARQHIEATVRNNKRPDGLYHSYNLLDWQNEGVEVEHLYEMLEGQVAALSSGLLTATEAVTLLDSLRASALYRENQNSYLLYPDRKLPRFLQKNLICAEFTKSNPLLQKLLKNADKSVVARDVHGDVHFNGRFRNSSDLKVALDNLGSEYETEVQRHAPELLRTFDEIFGHRLFTGRSGTFFAYEGLGSIYWHMVSKLGLAVSENYFQAIEHGDSPHIIQSLRSHFSAIRSGIGAEKSPAEYGAFPSDAYSHTPENIGVKQPGMTGQVKEDILARFSEIGVHIEDGSLSFRLDLLDISELRQQPGQFTFYNIAGNLQTVQVPERGFGFTLFQVPFTYQPGDIDSIQIHFVDGEQQSFHGLEIDQTTSAQLFSRSGEIINVQCEFKALRK